MANQLFSDGDAHEVNGQMLECVSVSYQETDGEKHNFVYAFRLKSELDAEREAEAARQAELEASVVPADETRELSPAELDAQQANNEVEETQYVK